MDKVVYLVEYLVKQIVNNPEDINISLDEEENYFIINIKVNIKDMGAIIGKSGNIANAIRTLAQAVAYANGEKKVKVNIDSI